MTDTLQFPFPQIPDPTTGGRIIYNGKIYIGNPDTDPTNAVNQVRCFYLNEAEAEIDLSQPIATNTNGLTVNPSGDFIAVKIDTEYNKYSLAIHDRNDVEQYYIPNMEEVNPEISIDVEQILIDDLSQAYVFDTVALMESSEITFPVGKVLNALDRKATYIVKAIGTSVKFGDTTLLDSKVCELQTNGEVTTTNINGTSEAIIYVSKAGNDSNSGYSASPLLTIQAAVDRLAELGQQLTGSFIIDVGNGTYDRVRFPDQGIQSDEVITIQGQDVGGHPNVPTVDISEGSTVTAEGVYVRNETKVLLKDIHVHGFNGSTSSAGFSVAHRCSLYTDNAHFTDNYSGVTGLEWSEIDVKGGIFDGNGYLNGVTQGGYAIRGLFNTKFSVGTQNAGDLTQGPIIKNGYIGVFGQEGCTGHVDWVTFEDNHHAVRATVLTRF